jgi:hypothetical protein
MDSRAPHLETGPATFRSAQATGRRDALLIGALAAATVAIALADLSGAERVLPLTAIAAVTIGWARSRREQWSLGRHGISHRRWFTTRTAPSSTIRSVEIVPDSHGIADEVVFVGPGVSIPVSLFDVQSQPAFAAELRDLLASVVEREVPGADRALALL